MKRILFIVTLVAALCVSVRAQSVVRLGIIGLDTSHSIAFTKVINDKESEDPQVRKFEVVAAYPYGTSVIESAAKRIPQYTKEIQDLGVIITSSIEELLGMVDCVFVETNDGHMHLDQALKVFKAGKGCYIDKPLGATLGEAIAIYEMADKYGIPIFSSSALRFASENVKIRAGKYGSVKGADCYSPHHPEKTHPDFGYYGIHGVESLYTVMGEGCEYVSRIHSDEGDIVCGRWKDGRLGSFRAIATGPNVYGGTVITQKKKDIPAGVYEGYKPLLKEIMTFFETGIPPVSKEETLEIFAFMEASNLSLERDGKYVRIEEAMKRGQKEARKILKKINK